MISLLLTLTTILSVLLWNLSRIFVHRITEACRFLKMFIEGFNPLHSYLEYHCFTIPAIFLDNLSNCQSVKPLFGGLFFAWFSETILSVLLWNLSRFFVHPITKACRSLKMFIEDFNPLHSYLEYQCFTIPAIFLSNLSNCQSVKTLIGGLFFAWSSETILSVLL